jgi:hypothetical protein
VSGSLRCRPCAVSKPDTICRRFIVSTNPTPHTALQITHPASLSTHTSPLHTSLFTRRSGWSSKGQSGESESTDEGREARDCGAPQVHRSFIDCIECVGVCIRYSCSKHAVSIPSSSSMLLSLETPPYTRYCESVCSLRFLWNARELRADGILWLWIARHRAGHARIRWR